MIKLRGVATQKKIECNKVIVISVYVYTCTVSTTCRPYEELLSKIDHLPSKVSIARSFEAPTC